MASSSFDTPVHDFRPLQFVRVLFHRVPLYQSVTVFRRLSSSSVEVRTEGREGSVVVLVFALLLVWLPRCTRPSVCLFVLVDACCLRRFAGVRRHALAVGGRWRSATCSGVSGGAGGTASGAGGTANDKRGARALGDRFSAAQLQTVGPARTRRGRVGIVVMDYEKLE